MDAESRAAMSWLADPRTRIDEKVATEAFERALGTYSQGFDTFFLAKLLALKIAYTDSTCVVEMLPRDFMFNPQGSLHGGLVATLLDISMGHLLKHLARPGVTLEMKVQYVRAIRHQRVRCEASFIKRGRSINYLQARVLDDDGRVLAVGTSTWQLLVQAPPAAHDR